MSTLFSLNINKIALIRNSRDTNYPSLEQFAEDVLARGVKGLTLHPRHDERHIKYADLAPIKAITTEASALNSVVEMNVEGYPDQRFIDAMLLIKPDQITLVPDASSQLTSDHGWGFDDLDLLTQAVNALRPSGSRICLFIDPNQASVEACLSLGVDGIELYTEPYARAFELKDAEPQAFESLLKTYADVATYAKGHGLRVNAGHDLNLENLSEFLQACSIDEVSIGHGATVECIYMGLDTVIARYLEIFG
ncbi:MAG: pyridoxine 5'-phosphate synthase [Psychrobacter sp.]|nr:pyridoxine 5'-phosphate synthase [Psychrobacter sp.]